MVRAQPEDQDPAGAFESGATGARAMTIHIELPDWCAWMLGVALCLWTLTAALDIVIMLLKRKLERLKSLKSDPHR